MSAERPTPSGVIDTLCNAFTPDRRRVWDGALAASGVQVKIRRDDGDSFAVPEAMVDRMDKLGVATILLISGDLGGHGRIDPFDFEHVIARWEETEKLASRWPGRFAALALIDPDRGMAGVVEMQAGTSGGLLPSECGRPITIDRAALYFRETCFVLSHLGWPWVDEAVAMALKFPNVYLGTAAYPPRHWPAPVREFLRGPGRRKVVFGTNFSTVGHRHALGQIDELDLDADTQRALLGDTARNVFTRLSDQGG